MRKRLAYTFRLLVMTSLIIWSTLGVAEDWFYTVRSGDNLWNLTEKHLTSLKYVSRLQQLNGIQDPYLIPPGTKIRIPVAWTKRQPGSAHIVGIHGAATVQRNNSQTTIPAEHGLQLFTGDEIQSEEDAYVSIEFADRSRLRVQEKSRVRLSLLEILGDLGSVETTVDLIYGRTENTVPVDAEVGSRFSIETPSAISSVRGTDFRVGAMAQEESTSSEVLTGSVQVSGDRRKIRVPAGYGSVTVLGASPSPPVALLPPPDLSVTPTMYERIPLSISLNPLSGAQAYRAQIAKDAEFQDLWADFTTATLPFREGDIPDGDYWLRVRGIDGSGIEGHDAAIAFTLNARPEPPFVTAPLPDAVVDGENPAFYWTVQSEVAHYIVAISQSSDFSGPLVFDSEVTGNNLRLPKSLEPGHYFWRIASVSMVEGEGPFSDSMTFRVPIPGPSLEETEIDESEMTFAWRAATEGQRFQFQFARDEEFTDILYDQQTTDSFATLPRPSSGSYFLRIKTIEADGFEGPYGPPQLIDIPYATPYWLLLLLLPLLILL